MIFEVLTVRVHLIVKRLSRGVTGLILCAELIAMQANQHPILNLLYPDLRGSTPRCSRGGREHQMTRLGNE
jgi:hypothetical protein